MTQPGPSDDPIEDFAREEAGLIEQSEIPPAVEFDADLHEAVAKRYSVQTVWDLDTATALTCGHNPEVPWPRRGGGRLEIWRKYAKQNGRASGLKFPVSPRDFLDWAQTTGEQGLCSQKAVSQLWSLLPGKPRTRNEIVSENEKLQALHGEKLTRLDLLDNLKNCLFFAAIELARTENLATKSAAAGKLAASITINSLTLDSDTICGYLTDVEIKHKILFKDLL